MKIAIIGAGISGLTAAWLLHRRHEISLFESAPRVGGHTATVDCIVNGEQHAVDTGFIVFNDRTYPGFNRLIERLGVGYRNTEMGFSVSTRHRPGDSPGGRMNGHDFEYCGSDLNGIFADRRRLLDPAFLGMLRDIMRFGKRARSDLESGAIPPGQSLGKYLAEGRYGDLFIDRYITPMASAIWSTPTNRISEFEALFFVRFFRNHGLLDVTGRPQWRVIEGGSRSYIPPMTAPFEDRILTAAEVHEVRREAGEVVEGSLARIEPEGEVTRMWEAIETYMERKQPLIIIAGADYGQGSSRDWAAKGVRLAGVEAIVAEGFERIHRTNLVGMGVLPLEFRAGENRHTYAIDGTETFDVVGEPTPQAELTLVINRRNGEKVEVAVTCRLDTAEEVSIYSAGGVLQRFAQDFLESTAA